MIFFLFYLIAAIHFFFRTMKRFAFYGLVYVSMWVGSIRLRRYDRELSELVEDYMMALCVVLAWACCWWLSITSAGRRRVGIFVSAVSLVVVATGLYQVLQVARGTPVGLVQQVVQIVLGLIVMIIYMKERYYV